MVNHIPYVHRPFLPRIPPAEIRTPSRQGTFSTRSSSALVVCSALVGGKWACGLDRMAKQDKCVIYSFGINGGSSFELPLLECASCRVCGCDYSVNSWGPEITGDPELRRAHLKPFALSAT
ncbi:hypothetical protein EDB92DRAFT_1890527 [Lactarius akahatsu]|uniref:Methyltransferase domain-containing protein n=1 Tax=Lactarius akahatsu TaxID=416441 RepID=A0AAD4LDY4_9AGAM|nr:hypothetical protein EDB92DRAFT_1890527 [Lactarius akahatsu]